MDPWDHIRRAVSDTRSGSLEVCARAAAGLAGLRTRRDIARAGRALIKAHPAMALVRRLVDEALDDGDPLEFVTRARAETKAAADQIRWVLRGRSNVVVTHSGSAAVLQALQRARARISSVVCTASLPGGEGRGFARRLDRDGFDVSVIPDAGVARACGDATVALVGADAITGDGVVNKVGTHVLALAALDAGIGCYAIGCSSKLIASGFDPGEPFESTPLALFDAVLTDRGALRPAQIRRAVARL
ncbi:MAG: hypothetical protein ABR552_01730 [Actinomycetota bacterium]